MALDREDAHAPTARRGRRGDATVVGERRRELERWLDRAAANGKLHKNTAARRKAQAARLVAGERDA